MQKVTDSIANKILRVRDSSAGIRIWDSNLTKPYQKFSRNKQREGNELFVTTTET